MVKIAFFALAYIVIAPFIGGLINGIDRKISARMQGRFGPPVLQPFYDVLKLFEKDTTVVRSSQNLFIVFFLIFIIFSGALFFAGGDILLFIFALMLANIFLILGGYKGSSPYNLIGSQRELLQKISIEPMMLLSAMGIYLITKSFYVSDIMAYPKLLIIYLPGIFIGFIYVLTIKLRKSPFDISTSHHAHQEIVSGITTEYSGSALALIEIAHWYELVFILGMVYLFFAANPLLAILALIVVYFLEIVIDNTCARVKWPLMLKSSWLIALTLGIGNIILLYFI